MVTGAKVFEIIVTAKPADVDEVSLWAGGTGAAHVGQGQIWPEGFDFALEDLFGCSVEQFSKGRGDRFQPTIAQRGKGIRVVPHDHPLFDACLVQGDTETQKMLFRAALGRTGQSLQKAGHQTLMP